LDTRGGYQGAGKPALVRSRAVAAIVPWPTFSFFIVVIAILVGAVLVFFDKSAEGIATILVPLASIIAIFAYRETQSAREGKEQQDPPT
jgi:uncharacterized membrane protein